MRSSVAWSGLLLLLGLTAFMWLLPVDVTALGAAPGPIFESFKIWGSDGSGFDDFGTDVDIDGDRLVVSAVAADVMGNGSGSIYIFERLEPGGTEWVETQILTAADGGAGDLLGRTISLEGDRLLVTSENVDTADGENACAAYIFERQPITGLWVETDKLTASDGAEGDGFGSSGDLDGDTLVIGAFFADTAEEDAGAAYVFSRDPIAQMWVETAKLVPDDLEFLARLGGAVAIDGNTVVVGAERQGINGAVYVFERDAGGPEAWGQVKKIEPPDGGSSDRFGRALDLEEDTLVVGAETHNPDGAVYVYERYPGAAGHWRLRQKLTPFAADVDSSRFGGALALEGDALLVGDSFQENSSGGAFLFTRDPDGVWNPTVDLRSSDGSSSDRFGDAIGLDGETLLVGATGEDEPVGNAGAAYLYETGQCELRISLERRVLRGGESLAIRILLQHSRFRTVTEPFTVWIEDENGSLIRGRATEPLMIRYGDRLQPDVTLRLPETIEPGTYFVMVGIEGMQQVASEALEPSAAAPSPLIIFDLGEEVVAAHVVTLGLQFGYRETAFPICTSFPTGSL